MECTDDRGRRLVFDRVPERIVSLVPSTTETVFDLGSGSQVVGITRFCVHPRARLRGLPRVGGTKDVSTDAVLALKPDLVLANCEENTREILAALDPHVPVLAAFPRSVDGALADLLRLGQVLGRPAQAAAWHARICAARQALATAVHDLPIERVAYFIWRKPWMVAGTDTFIASLLAEAKLRVWPRTSEARFPEVDPGALVREHGVQRFLLSSEPFPFRAEHAQELAASTGLPLGQMVGVNGEHLSWHGTRLVEGLASLRRARQAGTWPALTARSAT